MTTPTPSSHPLQAASWLSYLTEIPTALLVHAQWAGSMPFHRAGTVAGAVDDPEALLPEGFELPLDQCTDGDRRIVAAWPGLLAEVGVRHRVTSFDVVGAELTAVQQLVDRLKAGAQAATAVPEGSVRMHFWSYRDDVGQMSTRRVDAPAWDDVVGNYARGTAAGLAALMAVEDMSSRAGRLVLWHGVPGTGKTTAVRALSSAWSGWCQAHLRADAELRAGASLGRLLNLCDGILGHGSKVLVLLTTNEDVGRLHPAITRPGRCLSSVEFAPLSVVEARTWSGSDAVAPERPVTLAELFAIREQRAGAGPTDPALGRYL